MAAPTLQAQGSLAVVTTGDLTVTLPAHQADDILVVTAIIWADNTVPDLDAFPAVSGWTLKADIPLTVAGLDGRAAFYWKRATSGSETNPTITRGANWDTGTDTCFSGRAYVIRGCATTGDPWDDFQSSTFTTAANPTFPALTVSAAERMAVLFFCSTDNNSAGTVTGWTAGTAVTTTTGTDAGFQDYRQDNISSSTSSGSSTAAAPGQGQHGFFGVTFKPPAGGTAFTITPAGAVSPSGALARATGKHAGGTVGPSGLLSRLVGKRLSGTVSPAGALARLTGKSTAGQVGPSGALTRVAGKRAAGTVSPAGSITRAATKILSGHVDPSGGVAKASSKPLAGQTTPQGALARLTAKLLGGAVSPSGGSAFQQVKAILVAGTIAPAGALMRSVTKPLAGAIAPAGALTRSALKRVGGAIAPVGSLLKDIGKRLAGLISPGGALTSQHSIAGQETKACLTVTVRPFAAVTASAAPAAHLELDAAPPAVVDVDVVCCP